MEESACARPLVRFGLVADCHSGDLPPAMGRHYRESPARLRVAVGALRDAGAELLFELGDLKDAGADREETLVFLREIARELRGFPGEVVPVLGNHDVDLLTKGDFLSVFAESAGLPATPPPRRAFDRGGVRFVVLDNDFRPDGEPYAEGRFDWRECIVPDEEIAWLRAALAEAAGRPAVVLLHARLEGDGHSCTVRNAPAVRTALEEAGNVRAVFQGHHHEGCFARVRGIGYCTLPALCQGGGPESNSYALATVFSDGRVSVSGYGRAPALVWRPPRLDIRKTRIALSEGL